MLPGPQMVVFQIQPVPCAVPVRRTQIMEEARDEKDVAAAACPELKIGLPQHPQSCLQDDDRSFPDPYGLHGGSSVRVAGKPAKVSSVR